MKGKMKLEIQKLGPLRESEIELGNITVFLGPPNSGKSYALKALYSALIPLDYFAIPGKPTTLIRKIVLQLRRSNVAKLNESLIRKEARKVYVKDIRSKMLPIDSDFKLHPYSVEDAIDEAKIKVGEIP